MESSLEAIPVNCQFRIYGPNNGRAVGTMPSSLAFLQRLWRLFNVFTEVCESASGS